jgi:tRNA(Ile)-lysidine synthase
MPTLPDSATLLRFRRDLEALSGRDPACLAIALSGGPDSLALLLLAHGAFPGRVEAATVDHRLRGGSAAEAARAAAMCEALAIPHAILPVSVGVGGDGVQAEARRARYAALCAWCETRDLSLLLTAHHRDDQAETLLMRLARGSGLPGLCAIRAARPEGRVTLLRPLLGWSREELHAIATASGLAPADDPSNRDPRFDRTHMRRLLAEAPMLDPPRLARSAAALAEAEDALAWSADRESARIAVTADGCTLDPAGLPRALRRRLVVRAVSDLRRRHGIEPEWTGSEDVEALLATLEAGGTATRAGIRATGRTLPWRLSLAPPRRSG